MPEEEKTVTPREFLETWGLYRVFLLDTYWSTPERISRRCPACGKETTWVSTSKQFPPRLMLYYLEYTCADCQGANVMFVLRARMDNNKNFIEKIGQWPEPSINIPRKLETRLGDDTELYKKALICRNQGFGIGAVAYMRRVVENKTSDLIDTVADLAESHGATREEVEKLRTAKNEKQYDKRLEVACALVPQALLLSGINPIGGMHDLLSQGIHGLTEEECLQIVDDLRDHFEHVFTTLRAQIDDQKRFVERAKKLAGRLRGNPS